MSSEELRLLGLGIIERGEQVIQEIEECVRQYHDSCAMMRVKRGTPQLERSNHESEKRSADIPPAVS